MIILVFLFYYFIILLLLFFFVVMKKKTLNNYCMNMRLRKINLREQCQMKLTIDLIYEIV